MSENQKAKKVYNNLLLFDEEIVHTDNFKLFRKYLSDMVYKNGCRVGFATRKVTDGILKVTRIK